MPRFIIPPEGILNKNLKNEVRRVRLAEFERFGVSVLGLGDVRQESFSVSTIAAVFDLEGFTLFCGQIEPQLSIPDYLSGFLDWIFAELKKQTLHKVMKKDGIAQLWHDLPFFVKFMGDGLLVLWDTAGMGPVDQHNLIISLYHICARYRNEFCPTMKGKVIHIPPRLRCGVAKGTVYSVGDGNDFVGTSINLAARLQKLNGIRFAFSRRGFDPETVWKNNLEAWQLVSTRIRGIGDGELIFIRKTDYAALSPADQKEFKVL